MDALNEVITRNERGFDIEAMPHWRDVVLPRIPTVSELLGVGYSDEISRQFPDVQPPVYPTGINIIVQLRMTGHFKILANGTKFFMPDEAIDADKARAQTALVRAVGPAAYRNRQTLKLWPEGYWCVPGQFIRTPMYGGDRIEVPVDPDIPAGDFALFATFRDQDCLGVVTVDPLKIKTS
jgi:hypothetical protein